MASMRSFYLTSGFMAAELMELACEMLHADRQYEINTSFVRNILLYVNSNKHGGAGNL